MTNANKRILEIRLKSFAWRAGVMLATVAVAFLAQNINLFNLPTEVRVLLGLVLGEVTKYLNTKNEPI